MDKVSVAVLAALIVLAPLGYGVYHFSQTDDAGDEIIEEEEEVIDHSAHDHPAPALEALLMSFEGEQFIAGNVIHDHPMEVRIQWTMESAEGVSSGANLATDLDGSWSFDIDVDDRSEDISITFRAHNLPEDTWSDNLTIVIPADVEDNNTGNNTDNNTGNSTGNNTDNNTGNNTGSGNGTGVNSPPNCDAGQDLISDVDELVYLDASNSSDPDGDSLQNPSWQITERPENSMASIVNPSSVNAEFVPDVIGNFTIEFYVDDGEDFCKDSMQLEAVITVPSISPNASSQVLTNGTAMEDITFTSEGGHVDTWEISPSLPSGLSFDIDSGRISGTPSEAFEETTFIVYANNSAGSATASITLSAIELGYDRNDLAQFWLDFFFCQTTDDRPTVDDLTTSQTETLQCEISITLNETHLIISTNGIPNHDFESTLACSQGGDCTKVQDYTWSIPRNPTNDTTGGHDSANCPEANGEYECAPDRGPIAVAMNGVPIFGPEDGPGGDAVAAEHGVYNEDRQPIELGLCHGHAAQGGTYHYHADSNCMHWHPEEGENIKDDYDDSAPELVAPNTYDGNHSKVIGVAFDGYPIYGFWGYDDEMNVVEMKSSYELKSGETGYNGIDDYQYVEGLGHLDVCNGHFGITPDFPQGIYHYHTTMQNGDGDMGFPYFLICYHGEADMSGDDDDPCAGFGETWGPGIGPPPPGCEGGGQNGQAEGMVVSAWQFNPFAIIILGLMLVSGWRLWRR
ncbi:MAG: YHYH protein [Candidatus Poseidoniaceae archaeon]|nr:YHYH protein [Candidatus Poseidoniaceae archaeon]